MPLTPFQATLLADLSPSQNDDRYLAGGAALHIAADSARYSNDLDFFHDSEPRVARAFNNDRSRLQGLGYSINLEFNLPGFVRATVERNGDSTRVDWAHDSAWRFMPLERDALGGLLLHPVDLAINKLLALAGRDEPRDFVDILWAHERILPLAGLCWAAPGKDPGLTPMSIMELLKRRGRYRAEDFADMHLTAPFDLATARTTWANAMNGAGSFVDTRPPAELGCLYRSNLDGGFVIPASDLTLEEQGISTHYGAPGGVIARIAQ